MTYRIGDFEIQLIENTDRVDVRVLDHHFDGSWTWSHEVDSNNEIVAQTLIQLKEAFIEETVYFERMPYGTLRIIFDPKFPLLNFNIDCIPETHPKPTPEMIDEINKHTALDFGSGMICRKGACALFMGEFTLQNSLTDNFMETKSHPAISYSPQVNSNHSHLAFPEHPVAIDQSTDQPIGGLRYAASAFCRMAPYKVRTRGDYRNIISWDLHLLRLLPNLRYLGIDALTAERFIASLIPSTVEYLYIKDPNNDELKELQHLHHLRKLVVAFYERYCYDKCDCEKELRAALPTVDITILKIRIK